MLNIAVFYANILKTKNNYILVINWMSRLSDKKIQVTSDLDKVRNLNTELT